MKYFQVLQDVLFHVISCLKLKDNLKTDLSLLIQDEYGQAGFEKKTESLDSLQTKVNLRFISVLHRVIASFVYF